MERTKFAIFAFALKEREENNNNNKKSPTISKWCNGGVFKESLCIIIMRGGRGRRVREWEWEWDAFFCAETWVCNNLFCVLFLGSSISTFVLCYLINFGSILVFFFKIKRKNVCLLWRRRRRRTHYHVFVACGMFEFCISSKWCSMWSWAGWFVEHGFSVLLLDSTQVIDFDEKVEELFFFTINQAHLRSIPLICHISLVLFLFLFLFLQEIVFFSKFLFEGEWNQRERHTHRQVWVWDPAAMMRNLRRWRQLWSRQATMRWCSLSLSLASVP